MSSPVQLGGWRVSAQREYKIETKIKSWEGLERNAVRDPTKGQKEKTVKTTEALL